MLGLYIAAFIDASKAFDKVLHNGLFVKLLQKGVYVKFVRILQNWNSKLYASVLWNGLLSNIFLILCGVMQGGVLSRLLFSVYVDDLIGELRLSGYGAYIAYIVCWNDFLC